MDRLPYASRFAVGFVIGGVLFLIGATIGRSLTGYLTAATLFVLAAAVYRQGTRR
jgi:hypothetical protein